MSTATYDVWFAFDRAREDGHVVSDELFAYGDLTRGERAFLETLKRSSMRLYEIEELFPGLSLKRRAASFWPRSGRTRLSNWIGTGSASTRTSTSSPRRRCSSPTSAPR
jgi:hypothetical protein